MFELKINGEIRSVDVDSDTPLLWVLRDTLGLTGTKYACGAGVCGSCTVHVDGKATRSCITPVSTLAGKEITTIEGLGAREPHPVQIAWLAQQVPQCGYCQSGMIMCVAGAMNAGHHGKAIESELQNLCVCGTYPRIKQAVAKL